MSQYHQLFLNDVAEGKISVILAASHLSVPDYEWLSATGLPVVGVNHEMFHPNLLGVDYPGLVDMGIDGLVRMGCRRIFLAGNIYHEEDPRYADVAKRFASRLDHYQLPFDPGQILPLELDWKMANAHECAGFAMGDFLLKKNPEGLTPRDGLLVMDDIVCGGLVKCLYQKGYHVGQTVRIATHSNKGSPVLYGFEEKLILLEVDVTEAAELLLDRVEELASGEVNPEQLMIRPRLKFPKFSSE
ncbi:MAG: substrate-binding domain-containing protein [Verrucomicrobiae bacterium]|nr:substrate-binding domain-containing protein [Verrucomicrobiae bacterium]